MRLADIIMVINITMALWICDIQHRVIVKVKLIVIVIV